MAVQEEVEHGREDRLDGVGVVQVLVVRLSRPEHVVVDQPEAWLSFIVELSPAATSFSSGTSKVVHGWSGRKVYAGTSRYSVSKKRCQFFHFGWYGSRGGSSSAAHSLK